MASKTLLSLGLSACAMWAAGSALADDANTDRPIMTYKQKMQMCMNKERQQDANRSDKDLKKLCSDKLQSYEQHPSETKTPPSNPTT
jgi:hypothetical protein